MFEKGFREKRLKPQSIILALLGGGAMQFAFSPFDYNWLAILAMALWAGLLIKEHHPFLISYAFGFGWFGFGSWWLADTFHLYGGLPYIAAFGCVVLVGLVMGLLPALWGWASVFLVRRLARRMPGEMAGETAEHRIRHGAIILVFPAMAVLIEWLRGHLFTGLPWTSLGNLLLDTPAIGWVAIVGVYGAAFLPALVAVSLAGFLNRRITTTAVIALACMVVTVLFTPGLQRIEGAPHTAALIQGNIPQDVKWDRAFLEETMQRYDRLSTSAADGSDIIVWPEAAIPFFLSRAPGWDIWLNNRVAVWNRPLLFGGLKITGEEASDNPTARNPTAQNPIAQNGLFLQMPAHGDRSFTGKHHLVPFGEYVPSWIPWLKKIVTNIADWQPAEDAGLLTDGDTVYGSLICYESIFPEQARARVAGGAQVLVVVTNDAWYGRSPAAWQHLQASRMRAVETGRYVLRAANTGVSAIVAPDGTIAVTAPWWTQAVVKGTYRPSGRITPYQQWGDLPALLLAGAFILAGVLWRMSRSVRSK